MAKRVRSNYPRRGKAYEDWAGITLNSVEEFQKGLLWANSNAVAGQFMFIDRSIMDFAFEFRFSDHDAAVHFRLMFGGTVC